MGCAGCVVEDPARTKLTWHRHLTKYDRKPMESERSLASVGKTESGAHSAGKISMAKQSTCIGPDRFS